MADFDNPFPDPFQDPSVRQLSSAKTRPIDDFNPFAVQPSEPVQTVGGVGGPGSAATIQSSSTVAPQLHATSPREEHPSPPPSYFKATEELQRRQDELERRAAELQRREEQIQNNAQNQERMNNFPPLPSSCPLKPCFYQDISLDIPTEFQSIVRMLYYLWIAYAVLLLLNMLGSLTYFITSSQIGANNRSGVTFGLSFLFLILFAPCSFVCWYRPVYKAFRSDSSFNFFVFFFIFFFQFCVGVIQFLGIDGFGTVGLINSLDMFTKVELGAKATAAVMLIIGFLFGLAALVDIIMLIRVHRIYRSTGASFAKAQAEFARGVASNKTVQETAGGAAASVARNAVNQSMSGSGNR